LYHLTHCSIDASKSQRFGRFVNDSPKKYTNAMPKAMYIGGIARLLLFATKPISAGTEIRYDYGGHLPWRKVACTLCKHLLLLYANVWNCYILVSFYVDVKWAS